MCSYAPNAGMDSRSDGCSGLGAPRTHGQGQGPLFPIRAFLVGKKFEGLVSNAHGALNSVKKIESLREAWKKLLESFRKGPLKLELLKASSALVSATECSWSRTIVNYRQKSSGWRRYLHTSN